MVKFSYRKNNRDKLFNSSSKISITPKSFTVKANQPKKYGSAVLNQFISNKNKFNEYAASAIKEEEPDLTNQNKFTQEEIEIYTQLSAIEELLIGILKENGIVANEMNPFCCDEATRRKIFKNLKIKSINSYALKLIDAYTEYLATVNPDNAKLNSEIIVKMTATLNEYFKSVNLGGRKKRRKYSKKRRSSRKRRRCTKRRR